VNRLNLPGNRPLQGHSGSIAAKCLLFSDNFGFSPQVFAFSFTNGRSIWQNGGFHCQNINSVRQNGRNFDMCRRLDSENC
jgi:hypothetical protein